MTTFRMQQTGKLAAVAVLALALSACSNLSDREQRALSGGAIGAAGGAVAGALLGNPAAGAAAGGAAGAAAGALINRDILE